MYSKLHFLKFVQIKSYQHKHLHPPVYLYPKQFTIFRADIRPTLFSTGLTPLWGRGCVTKMQWSLLDVYIKKMLCSTHLRVCGASMAYGLHARSSISRCSLCLPGAAAQSLSFISDGFFIMRWKKIQCFLTEGHTVAISIDICMHYMY